MKKQFVFQLILLQSLFFNLTLCGQKISSPYSVFGAGQITQATSGANPGLGNTGISYPSGPNGLNILNPASYSGIDSLSFLFDIGLSSRLTQYSTSRKTNYKLDANISHLVMGFRITRFLATGIGIQPYSSIGYNISSSSLINGTLSEYTKNFSGEGGINKFFLGNSLKINKNISLGMNISYLMGTINQTETGYENSLVPGYTLLRTQYLHNLTFDYGILLSSQIKGTTFRFGATYNQKNSLNTHQDIFFSSDIDTIEISGMNSSFSIPEGYGFGISMERSRILFGVDYQIKNWSGTRLDNNAASKIRNSEKICFGMQYIPVRTRSSFGFSILDYRIGAFYNKSYLVINNIPLNQKAITMGLGIPVNRKLSKLNLSFELGQYGTKTNGLIKENYIQMYLNFNLKDIWFQQTKYN